MNFVCFNERRLPGTMNAAVAADFTVSAFAWGDSKHGTLTPPAPGESEGRVIDLDVEGLLFVTGKGNASL